MAKMLINRIDEHAGYGAFKVYLDDTMIAKIHPNEELKFEVLPGKHSLYCKCGILSTRKISFKVQKEDRRFEIVSDDNAFSFFAQFLSLKDSFLTVRQRCVM